MTMPLCLFKRFRRKQYFKFQFQKPTAAFEIISSITQNLIPVNGFHSVF